jgi:hypothetical protein
VSSGAVPRRDVEIVYEGLLLSVVTRFEVLLEELFFGLMAGKVSPKSCGATPRIKPTNDRVVREIVLRDREYVDWMPYKRTEVLARAFLRQGLPFTAIDNGDRGSLGQLLIVRHAIAHRSKYSMNAFKDKVLGTLPLPPRERTPAGFLRSQFRIAPSQTRFELYVLQVRQIVYKITH